MVNFNEQIIRNYFSQQADIEFALLFGSFAKGRITPMSDIDVGIYFRGLRGTLELAGRQVALLIHEYRDILIEKVYDVLEHRLSDFQEYAQSILKYLKNA